MTWEPLAGDNPLPGNPAQIQTYAAGLTATADLIAQQVGMLRRLADPGSWVADTADAFRAQAQDLGEKITKAEDRYRTVGRELSGWSDELAEAQRQAGNLLAEAQQQQQVAAANPAPAPTVAATRQAPAEFTPEQQQQLDAGENAREEIDRLRGQLDSVVNAARQDAWERGRRIRASLDDGLGNSFWDRIQAFISNYAEALREIARWAGRVAIVLGAIALVIALLSNPAGWVVLLGAIATAGAAAATGVSLIANSGLAVSGNGGWRAVVFDAVALLSFGVGRWAGRGAQAARTLATGRGAQIAGTSASNASLAQNPLRLAAARFFSSNRMPTFLRNPAAGYVAGRNHAAAIAENVARDLVTTVPRTTLATRLLQGGETASVRAHAQQLLTQFPGVTAVTSPAVTALRLSNIQIGAYAAASASTVAEGIVDPTADNQIDALRVVVERLVLAR